MKKLIFIFYGFFLFTGTAYSQTSTPVLDKKQKAQKIAMVRGVDSGKLSRKEFKKLKRQQKKLHSLERKAKADGIVTRRERIALNRVSKATARQIRIEKNDSNRF